MHISTGKSWDSHGGAVPGVLDQNPPTLTVPDECLWYALQLRPHFEKKTDALLRSMGFETFLPLLRQVHRWSDRRKVVGVPMFPGYDFISLLLSTESRKRVQQTAGVIDFVSPHRPVPVPAPQIQALQKLLNKDVSCTIRPFLHTGQRVRIRDGALDGLEGILVEDVRKHLVISIECIQRSVCFSLDGYDLEVI